MTFRGTAHHSDLTLAPDLRICSVCSTNFNSSMTLARHLDKHDFTWEDYWMTYYRATACNPGLLGREKVRTICKACNIAYCSSKSLECHVKMAHCLKNYRLEYTSLQETCQKPSKAARYRPIAPRNRECDQVSTTSHITIFNSSSGSKDAARNISMNSAAEKVDVPNCRQTTVVQQTCQKPSKAARYRPIAPRNRECDQVGTTTSHTPVHNAILKSSSWCKDAARNISVNSAAEKVHVPNCRQTTVAHDEPSHVERALHGQRVYKQLAPLRQKPTLFPFGMRKETANLPATTSIIRDHTSSHSSKPEDSLITPDCGVTTPQLASSLTVSLQCDDVFSSFPSSSVVVGTYIPVEASILHPNQIPNRAQDTRLGTFVSPATQVSILCSDDEVEEIGRDDVVLAVNKQSIEDCTGQSTLCAVADYTKTLQCAVTNGKQRHSPSDIETVSELVESDLSRPTANRPTAIVNPFGHSEGSISSQNKEECPINHISPEQTSSVGQGNRVGDESVVKQTQIEVYDISDDDVEIPTSEFAYSDRNKREPHRQSTYERGNIPSSDTPDLGRLTPSKIAALLNRNLLPQTQQADVLRMVSSITTQDIEPQLCVSTGYPQHTDNADLDLLCKDKLKESPQSASEEPAVMMAKEEENAQDGSSPCKLSIVSVESLLDSQLKSTSCSRESSISTTDWNGSSGPRLRSSKGKPKLRKSADTENGSKLPADVAPESRGKRTPPIGHPNVNIDAFKQPLWECVGTIQPGSLVEVRVKDNPPVKDRGTTFDAMVLGSAGNNVHSMRYYIHFPNADAQYDRWIAMQDIVQVYRTDSEPPSNQTSHQLPDPPKTVGRGPVKRRLAFQPEPVPASKQSNLGAGTTMSTHQTSSSNIQRRNAKKKTSLSSSNLLLLSRSPLETQSASVMRLKKAVVISAKPVRKPIKASPAKHPPPRQSLTVLKLSPKGKQSPCSAKSKTTSVTSAKKTPTVSEAAKSASVAADLAYLSSRSRYSSRLVGEDPDMRILEFLQSTDAGSKCNNKELSPAERVTNASSRSVALNSKQLCNVRMENEKTSAAVTPAVSPEKVTMSYTKEGTVSKISDVQPNVSVGKSMAPTLGVTKNLVPKLLRQPRVHLERVTSLSWSGEHICESARNASDSGDLGLSSPTKDKHTIDNQNNPPPGPASRKYRRNIPAENATPPIESAKTSTSSVVGNTNAQRPGPAGSDADAIRTVRITATTARQCSPSSQDTSDFQPGCSNMSLSIPRLSISAEKTSKATLSLSRLSSRANEREPVSAQRISNSSASTVSPLVNSVQYSSQRRAPKPREKDQEVTPINKREIKKERGRYQNRCSVFQMKHSKDRVKCNLAGNSSQLHRMRLKQKYAKRQSKLMNSSLRRSSRTSNKFISKISTLKHNGSARGKTGSPAQPADGNTATKKGNALRENAATAPNMEEEDVQFIALTKKNLAQLTKRDVVYVSYETMSDGTMFVYPARILEVDRDMYYARYLIHYLGWGKRYNEWIAADVIHAIVDMGQLKCTKTLKQKVVPPGASADHQQQGRYGQLRPCSVNLSRNNICYFSALKKTMFTVDDERIMALRAALRVGTR